jgi:hypothetical protein
MFDFAIPLGAGQPARLSQPLFRPGGTLALARSAAIHPRILFACSQNDIVFMD